MKEITIDLKEIEKHGININEYLVLFDVCNDNNISCIFNYGIKELISLEKKGFIKLLTDEINLRGKALKIFHNDENLFEDWLAAYPTNVKKKNGGSRALSPNSANTILGKKLKNKWDLIFKKDKEKQYRAIAVLKAYVKDLDKSGDLEYAVEAARFLNEGFHEKYDYLINNDESDNLYDDEDYM